MTRKITDIKPQKKKDGRWSIYLDEEFAFGISEDQLLQLGIYQGQELSEQDAEELVSRVDEDKIYQTAVRYIALRPRSEYELSSHLKRKQYKQSGIDSCIARLRQAGLLDDAKFAQDWIQWRQATTPRSKRKLWAELKQKGLDDEIVDSALEAIDYESEVDAVIKIADKKASRYDSRDKLIAYLSRQGFSYDSIRQALEELDSR